jgi:dephospho-CoA kinase
MNVGLTGGIASGKSTVLGMFRELGAAIINADDIARVLTRPGEALTEEILNAFGREFATASDPSAIDRAKLGRAVFADPSLKEVLEAMTHPAIISEIKQQMTAVNLIDNRAIVIVEVPLLFEVRLESMFQAVIVVWCTEETQRNRLAARIVSSDSESISNRIFSQLPLTDKKERSDYIVNSELPIAGMAAEVASIYQLLVSISRVGNLD